MYLDAAASAKAIDGVVAERMRALVDDGLGNPSSAHHEGRRARRVLREAREEAAAALGAKADEVVFCSGATEAMFLALRGLVQGRGALEICAYEHPATFAAAEGHPSTRFRLDHEGRPERALSGLACVSLVNHEVGLLADIDSVTAHGAHAVVDAAQGFAHAKATWANPRVLALVLASHKIGGPSGVGLLLVRQGVPFVTTLRGGHQEHELRAGTEAVVSIAGFARALSQAPRDLSAVSRAFEDALAPTAHVIGADRRRAPGITAARMTGVPARALIERLDERGIYLSAGAACASQKNEPSNVIAALGLSRERGLEVFRVSFDRDADEATAKEAAAAIISAGRAIRGEAHAA